MKGSYQILKAKTDRGEKVRIIVKIKGVSKETPRSIEISPEFENARTVFRQRGLKPQREFPRLGLMVFEVNSVALDALIDAGFVEQIAEDIPQPPGLFNSINYIGANIAHNFGLTGANQAVAIIDTGVEASHPFLGNRVVEEACFSSNTSYSTSLCPNGQATQTGHGSAIDCSRTGIADCTHGTHVAGIAAGYDQFTHMSGVAPDANIVAVQVFSRFPATYSGCNGVDCILYWTTDLLAALEWVLNNSTTPNVAAINLSLEGGRYDSACDSDSNYSSIATSIGDLRNAGIATVICSGNEGYTDSVSAPGCISSAITVGSTQNGSDAISSYSNSAAMVDILAPGCQIYSSIVGGSYGYMCGTSMATPHVTGAFAVMRAKYPNATVGLIENLLEDKGVPVLDSRNNLTFPRLNLRAAIPQFDAGVYHTVSLKANGTLWTWGYNNYGLGDGTTSNKIYSVQIGAGSTWVSVATGRSHNIALKSDGTLWAWGLNSAGQLGDGTMGSKSFPVKVGTGNTWVSVAAGDYYTMAIKSDGTLWAWGLNSAGQLGDGTMSSKSVPVKVGTGNTWVSVAAGAEHTVAIKSDGTLWAWGDNNYGQLGDGTWVNKSSPVQIGAGNTWVSVSAGNYHTMAIKSDGTLWAWGDNIDGQLGDGTTDDEEIPVQIGAGSTWVTVAAGRDYTMGLKSDGTLWAWGYNYYGRLGDGTGVDRHSPVQIGAGSTWVSVAAGDYHTMALKSDGTLWAWGYNYYGQLGDGTTTNRLAPAQVTGNGRLLTVTKTGTGSGSVTSNPSGINCGTDCREGFVQGSSVTLIAWFDPTTSFTGWSGGCNGTNPSCTITMNADTIVTATFTMSGDTYQEIGVCDGGSDYDVCPIDTCDSNPDVQFTCPNGVARTCIDVGPGDAPEVWFEYNVTCIP